MTTRLMLICELHKKKFSTESYCECWEASEEIKKRAGSGSSTRRRCENCRFMPGLDEIIKKINAFDSLAGKNELVTEHVGIS